MLISASSLEKARRSFAKPRNNFVTTYVLLNDYAAVREQKNCEFPRFYLYSVCVNVIKKKILLLTKWRLYLKPLVSLLSLFSRSSRLPRLLHQAEESTFQVQESKSNGSVFKRRFIWSFSLESIQIWCQNNHWTPVFFHIHPNSLDLTHDNCVLSAD